MNICTLFRTAYPESILFNVQANNVCRDWTNEEIFREVSSLSSGLIRSGVSNDAHVLILTENCVETYIFSLALWNIGAIAVPVNPHLGRHTIISIISSISPVACFHDKALTNDLYNITKESCKLYISLGSKSYTHTEVPNIFYDTLLQYSDPIKAGDYPAEQAALIIHSSGTEGRPKQIQLTHQGLFNYFHYHNAIHMQFSEYPALDEPQKAFLSVFHPSHLAAYSLVLQGLLMRRPTYLLKGFSPTTYLNLISKLKSRLSVLVPSMYVALLRESSFIEENDLSGLSLCGSVGEPISEALIGRIENAFNARVFIGYGLTECLPGIGHSWLDLQQSNIVRNSSGKLLFGEVKIANKSGLDANPGELWIRNATVHKCYADDSHNRDKFTVDGWIKTGDLFYRDRLGNYFHKGRIDDMFVINGKNVYPAEVESAFIRHPSIERAVAVGVLDQNDCLAPAVMIQVTEVIEQSKLINHFLGIGPIHAIPRYIVQVDQLPELGSGKVNRKKCKEHLQAFANGDN